MARAQLATRLAKTREDLAELTCPRLSVAGEREPPGQALEERDAEVPFELLHLMADCRLGDAELDGCAREAEQTRCDLERPQRGQRRERDVTRGHVARIAGYA